MAAVAGDIQYEASGQTSSQPSEWGDDSKRFWFSSSFM